MRESLCSIAPRVPSFSRQKTRPVEFDQLVESATGLLEYPMGVPAR